MFDHTLNIGDGLEDICGCFGQGVRIVNSFTVFDKCNCVPLVWQKLLEQHNWFKFISLWSLMNTAKFPNEQLFA